MITHRRKESYFKIFCDGCRLTSTLRDSRFFRGLAYFTKKGWRPVLRGKIWHHYCPDCVKVKKHLQGSEAANAS